MKQTNKTPSDLTTFCPACGLTYEWKTWEEQRERIQMLQLTCPRCGDVKTFAVPRETIIKNIMEARSEDN